MSAGVVELPDEGRSQRWSKGLTIWTWILWLVFWPLLGWIVYAWYTGLIRIADLGGLLQGTVGVLATVISILYLIRSVRLATEQSQEQARESRKRADSLLLDRERERLDRALEERLGLLRQLSQSAPATGAVSMGHVEHLLRLARSYLRKDASVADVCDTASACLPALFDSDPYVNHLKLVFDAAANAELGKPQLVDHVWHSLLIEERALAIVLRARGDDLPAPTPASLASWKIALDPYLPWDTSKIMTEDFFK